MQIGVLKKSHMSRQSDKSTCRRFGVAHRLWGAIEPSFIDSSKIGKCSLASEQPLIASPDPVTDREPLHFGSNLDHGSCEIATNDVRKATGHRDRTGPDVGVNRIDRDRTNLDQYFVSARFRGWQFSVFNDRCRTRFANKCRLHTANSDLPAENRGMLAWKKPRELYRGFMFVETDPEIPSTPR